MFQIPSSKQWRDLFAISERLRQRHPWQQYPEELIFFFIREDREEPFYVTVHGYEEDVLGISVYPGKDDIKKYMNILAEGDEVSFQTILANQSCLSVLYGEKPMLGAGDFTAMESAQFTPDGTTNSYIHFRSYQPGFTPWYIGSEEVEVLMMGLTAFAKADLRFQNQPFDTNKEMVLCTEKNGEICVETVPFDESLREKRMPVVKDDFYIARLKRLKRNGRCLEIDVCYMTSPVGSDLGPIPFFPKLCVIADIDQGYIADQCIFAEGADEEEVFFSFLAKYFSENGLPRKINIREDGISYLLRDVCTRLNMTLEEHKELAIIDDFLNIVGNFSPEE